MIASRPNPVLKKKKTRGGDFKTGLAPWTGSGPGTLLGAQGIISADTNGQGMSQCFGLHTGGNVFNPPHPPYVLKQTGIVVIPSVTYEFQADVMIIAFAANAQGGIVEIKIGGVKVAEWTRFVGRITTGTYRDRVCARFTQKLVGRQDLTVEMGRPRFIQNTRTPAMFIDNISLKLVSDPILCHRGERKIGQSMVLEVNGQGSAAVALFLAAKRGPGLTIPTFSGKYELDLATTLFLLAGGLDKNGILKLTLPIPNLAGLVGVPLYWQGIQLTASTNSFGPSVNVAFYR